MEAAAAKLFNRLGEAWNHELPTWDEWYDSTLVYRRGFPQELRTVFRKLVLQRRQTVHEAPIRAFSVTTVGGPTAVDRWMLQSVGGGLPDLSGLRALASALGCPSPAPATACGGRSKWRPPTRR